MKELSNSKLKDINGGFFPILIVAAKIVAAGVATLAGAGAVVYGVGYYDGKRECEQILILFTNVNFYLKGGMIGYSPFFMVNL